MLLQKKICQFRVPVWFKNVLSVGLLDFLEGMEKFSLSSKVASEDLGTCPMFSA